MGLQRLHIFYSSGFTFIELIVVILILSVLAGASIAAFGPDFIEDKQQTATLYEMSQIRDAILKFKRDNPTHDLNASNLCSPADASFLFTADYSTDDVCDDAAEGTLSGWDPDYRIGWNGPYISRRGNPTRSISGAIQHDGSVTSGSAIDNVPVLTDAYDNGGNPYYFFDLDGDEARIVSFGENGSYDSAATTCDTALTNAESTDDLVLCLR